ncbi:MAG: DUF72 domain-containing protein [Janthinobacterium lividum]
MMEPPRVGVAGWSLRRDLADRFGTGDSQLARYATRFDCVEINSSFYRPHRPATYARWAEAVPAAFRFAVKMPRSITHEARLRDHGSLLDAFLEQTGALGSRRGPILVQLPPSLRFEPDLAERFFGGLRICHDGPVVCEARHASWFTEVAETVLRSARVARVAADPAPVPAAAKTGGWDGLYYHRLHGSPRTYYSGYGPERLEPFVTGLGPTADRWVIFDNTALGEAIPDALWLSDRLTKRPSP